MSQDSRQSIVLPLVAAILCVGCWSSSVEAAALWGPKSTFEPVGDPAPTLQDYDEEFRWSSEMGQLEVQFDTTFINFFHQAGVNRVTQALKSWDNGVGAAGRNALPGPPANMFDLESVAVHEIGHALGLDHPNTADNPADINNPARNWQEPIIAGFPHLLGISAPPAGGEVMTSTLGRGTARRDLTGDDVAGLNYLYDAGNANPKVGPELAAMVPGAGVGGLGLSVNVGKDNVAAMINDAQLGANVGDNIDIFAMDFNGFVIPDPEDLGSGGTQEVEIFKGTDGKTLAVTVIRFSFKPASDGPGIIDGTPNGFGDGAIDIFFAGADIIFNTAIMLPPEDGPGRGWYVPEPTTGAMLVIAAMCSCMRRMRRVVGG